MGAWETRLVAGTDLIIRAATQVDNFGVDMAVRNNIDFVTWHLTPMAAFIPHSLAPHWTS